MLSPTVLLVEDEPLILLLAQDVLEEAGFTVIPADDGLMALDLLAGHPEIDLLVTDINLPGMDGRELARHAREQRPEIPLIVASARHRLSADETPGGVFLPKPYSPYQLAELVRSELDRRLDRRDGCAVEAPLAGEGAVLPSAGLGSESAYASAGYRGVSAMDGARPAVV